MLHGSWNFFVSTVSMTSLNLWLLSVYELQYRALQVHTKKLEWVWYITIQVYCHLHNTGEVQAQ